MWYLVHLGSQPRWGDSTVKSLASPLVRALLFFFLTKPSKQTKNRKKCVARGRGWCGCGEKQSPSALQS